MYATHALAPGTEAPLPGSDAALVVAIQQA